MPQPKQEIHFAINTIEDMMFNRHIYSYFDFLSSLIDDGFYLSFYRRDEKLTTIKDKAHLENFRYSFRFIK
jgi:hypothetical protein